AYVGVMEEAERGTADKLFAVIEEKNPSLYRALLEKRRQHGNRNEMEKLLNKLVRNGEDAAVIKAYLRGDTTVDTLYPFAEKQGSNSYYGGEKERKAIEECGKNSLDEAFYRRFQTYMLLRRGSWYLLWFDVMDYPEGGMAQLNKEKVTELFQNFAYEGLDATHLLSGEIMLEQDLKMSDEGKPLENRKAGAFRTTVIKIFCQYLKNQREETVQAFAESDVRGRLFGLEVFSQEAEKNKKEILAYLADQTEEIREMLFDILSDQPDWGKDVAEALAGSDLDDRLFVLDVLSQNVQENKKEILAFVEDGARMIQGELFDILRFRTDWEEDVKELLASKKNATRRLAVDVLAFWQKSGADYRELFAQALEKEENMQLRRLLEAAIARRA
nr:hypothetical protein [Lachnospiraceae bacterium]